TPGQGNKPNICRWHEFRIDCVRESVRPVLNRRCSDRFRSALQDGLPQYGILLYGEAGLAAGDFFWRKACQFQGAGETAGFVIATGYVCLCAKGNIDHQGS
ncbi:AAEL006173-PA, partial [Aedes aegypti]